MTHKPENLYAALDRNYHEPNRLAIMSALCSADGGLSFNDVKEACGLTDGNLNRHLKTLEEAGAVRIRKSYKGVRPITTIMVSEVGREEFLGYLQTLEGVLMRAAEALRAEERLVIGRTLVAPQELSPGLNG